VTLPCRRIGWVPLCGGGSESGGRPIQLTRRALGRRVRTGKAVSRAPAAASWGVVRFSWYAARSAAGRVQRGVDRFLFLWLPPSAEPGSVYKQRDIGAGDATRPF